MSDKHEAKARELMQKNWAHLPTGQGTTVKMIVLSPEQLAAALRAAADDALEEAAKKLDITADDYNAACALLGTSIDHAITRHVNNCCGDELRAQAKRIRAAKGGGR